MLTDILHTGRLGQKFVNLIAHIKLLGWLEVSASQLLFDSGKYLQRTRILGLPRFVGDALLSVEDTSFEDRRPAMTGEVAWLHALFEVDVLDDRLPAVRCERRTIG